MSTDWRRGGLFLALVMTKSTIGHHNPLCNDRYQNKQEGTVGTLLPSGFDFSLEPCCRASRAQSFHFAAASFLSIRSSCHCRLAWARAAASVLPRPWSCARRKHE